MLLQVIAFITVGIGSALMTLLALEVNLYSFRDQIEKWVKEAMQKNTFVTNNADKAVPGGYTNTYIAAFEIIESKVYYQAKGDLIQLRSDGYYRVDDSSIAFTLGELIGQPDRYKPVRIMQNGFADIIRDPNI